MSTISQPRDGVMNPAQTLAMASIYTAAGVRVIPLKPHTKVPVLKDWPKLATTNRAKIQRWFGNGPAHNIGMVMGEWEHTATLGTYLVAIDLDVHDPEQNGVANWQALVDAHGGDMGAPFIADTATGGQHLVYQSPVAFTNACASNLGQQGIDVRGAGGQIMVEPSLHPVTGTSPRWRVGASDWPTKQPGNMPAWLVELLQTEPEPAPRPEPTPQPERKPALHLMQGGGDDTARPGDNWTTTHDWFTSMSGDGWAHLSDGHSDHGKTSNWLRPGKVAQHGEPPSAILYHDEGQHGVLVVFSTNCPRELQQAQFLTDGGAFYKFAGPWAYEVAMRHGGDFITAARTVGALQRQHTSQQNEHEQAKLADTDKNHAPQRDESGAKLQPVTDMPGDVAPPPKGLTYKLTALSELIGVPYMPRVPTLLLYDDGNGNQGTGLQYANAHNMNCAPPGAMKTWISCIDVHQQIKRGNHCVIIDYEMNWHDWFTRLRAMGATDTELKLVHYCAPDEALRVKLQYGVEGYNVDAVAMLASEVQRVSELGTLALIAIDGVTNAMTQNNLNYNDNTEIAKFWQILPERLVRLTGAGIAINDHVPKNSDGSTRLPIGGQHKMATLSGAGYTSTASSYMSRNPLHDGVVNLYCWKDRHGEIGQGRTVAQVILSPHDNGTVTYQVMPYSDTAAAYTNVLQQKMQDALRECAGLGREGTVSRLANMAGSNKGTAGDTLAELERLGLARNEGRKKAHNWRPVTPADNAPQLIDDPGAW